MIRSSQIQSKFNPNKRTQQINTAHRPKTVAQSTAIKPANARSTLQLGIWAHPDRSNIQSFN
ncbi:MAG: hypothetical protein B7Y07_04960 [Halothiobacillus sp. 24-54-40]|nr:MAG: hypothetical protein B7Y58_06235 [Halothiobacillus sp. 35-54-62]OYY55158.1 MAG: hypothetical protein B7Y53_04555 [Halothiobacillus sp. 28-55-5]OYZ87260.1 MAG: hypothetical protein B7Y07_04960 [Halothiobacillus sp. 24-54-40]OZA80824.1 MAG: hypothetical protein B7X64_04150 [Halothiobacillus sp. 39-53-45]